MLQIDADPSCPAPPHSPRHFGGLLPAALPPSCPGELLGLVLSRDHNKALHLRLPVRPIGRSPVMLMACLSFWASADPKRDMPRFLAHLVLDLQILLNHRLLGTSSSSHPLSSLCSMPQYYFSCLRDPHPSWLFPFLVFLHLHES